jgi:hypothetical protein
MLASQCKRAQSGQDTMLQRLEEESQKTQADVLKSNRTEISLQTTLHHLNEVTLPTFIYKSSHWRILNPSSALLHLQVGLLLERSAWRKPIHHWRRIRKGGRTN